jgi:hypothetical protein
MNQQLASFGVELGSDRLVKTVLTIQYFDKLGAPRLV